eukprot:8663970-Alexandrium_andersonii.AAC.1
MSGEFVCSVSLFGAPWPARAGSERGWPPGAGRVPALAPEGRGHSWPPGAGRVPASAYGDASQHGNCTKGTLVMSRES